MPPHFTQIPTTPHIRTLPLTASGMRVPYTTAYAPDDGTNPTGEATLPSGGRIVTCSCELGRGRPRFGRPCPHRQRTGIRKRRCVTCGKPVPPGTTAVFIGAEHNTLPGLPHTVLTSFEPPAHPTCAAYSALTCPRLYANLHDVPVVLTRDYGTWKQVVLGTLTTAAPLDQPVQLGTVDMHIAILNRTPTRALTLDQWMTHEAPKPYRGLHTT